MAWFPCPICTTKNPTGTMRCTACGADFDDPDVRALGGEAAAMSSSSLGTPGSLSASRFLGFSLEGAVSGGAARRVALVGGGLLLAGFLAPLTINYRELVPAWKAMGDGPALALLFPLAAVVLALGAAFAPLPARARGAVLVALGLAGLATLPWLGRYAGAPAAPLALFGLFMPLAAAAIGLRLHDPGSQVARKALAVLGGLALLAMFIPISGADRVLPLELRFYLHDADALSRATTVGAFAEVMNRDANVLFLCLWAFFPLVLLPGAVALAWPRPSGVWDTSGKVLRPVGWIVAFYVPLAYLLYAFNLTGWDMPGLVSTGEYVAKYDDFVKTTMVGRAKLALLAGGFSLFAAMGAMPLLKRERS